MPAKGTKTITEQLFNTVTAQLKSNVKTTDMLSVIAAANGIKPSTVREIRGVKTWDKWQARKAAKVAKKSSHSLKINKAKVFKAPTKITVKAAPTVEYTALRDELATLQKQLDGQRRLIMRLSDWVTVVEHNSVKRVWGRK